MASIGDHYTGEGRQVPVRLPVAAASADIGVGDMLTIASGLISRAGSGDAVFGFAMEQVTSPAANSGASVLVDRSRETIYRFPINTGSAAITLVTGAGNADAGAYSADGGSTVDVTSPTNSDLVVVGVDLDTNDLLVTRA